MLHLFLSMVLQHSYQPVASPGVIVAVLLPLLLHFPATFSESFAEFTVLSTFVAVVMTLFLLM